MHVISDLVASYSSAALSVLEYRSTQMTIFQIVPTYQVSSDRSISIDTRYIEVSRYHEVSISNVHKYRDTSIYRVSNQQ